MPEAHSSAAPRAVFLSYSREDAEPARRIADALRAFGVEVWFDQNELRGGDSWDAKIKRQIRECALFLPIISSHTQTRMEGYFRREWKLGVERTHDMAGGVAFITPVVIDETAESAALVPEEFMRYQWTRLPHGVPTPEFVGQVKRLLEAPHSASPVAAPARHAVPIAGAHPPAHGRKPGMPGWAWGALAAAAVAVVAFLLARRPQAPAASAPAVAEAKPSPTPPPVSDKSVAVLPFENMSEEKDASAFFADGVQEDILTNLSFLHDLRVVSRTSVMQYRGTVKPIRQIAQELGVSYILEGSVRRAGNKVRVTGQLIHAATDEHVWAKAYDRDVTDVFAIQAELAQAIASAMQAAISPAEQTLLDRKPTSNPAAYDLYLKARAAYESNDIDVNTQVGWLLDAVQLDPGFAQAWALLAANHAAIHFAEINSSPQTLVKAKSAIETAVRLAPDDPVVIEMQGDYYYYGFRDYASAAAQYRRLQSLRPNSSEAFGSLGLIYRRQGRAADAIENFRRALELDPHNMRYGESLGAQLQAQRHYAEATAQLAHVSELNPGDLIVKSYAALIPFLARGSKAESEAAMASLRDQRPDDPVALDVRKGLARQIGDFAEALALDARQKYFDGGGQPHWAQDLNEAFDHLGAGDAATGRSQLDALLPALQAELANQPANTTLLGSVGITQAILGKRDEALASAARMAELLPESSDSVDGPVRSAYRAKILAWAGEKDKALAELTRLMHTPYGTNVYSERVDPAWGPLRGDPRFEAILADPGNNGPID